MTKHSYTILFEQSSSGWTAHTPDLPILVSAPTKDEARTKIWDGISIYLEEMKEAGFPIPEPASSVESLVVHF